MVLGPMHVFFTTITPPQMMTRSYIIRYVGCLLPIIILLCCLHIVCQLGMCSFAKMGTQVVIMQTFPPDQLETQVVPVTPSNFSPERESLFASIWKFARLNIEVRFCRIPPIGDWQIGFFWYGF